MGMGKEFREFISKGNVVDLAVGVVIGAAFGKIVSKFVENLIMPFIGLLTPSGDWRNFGITLSEGPLKVVEGMDDKAKAEALKDDVILKVGDFLDSSSERLKLRTQTGKLLFTAGELLPLIDIRADQDDQCASQDDACTDQLALARDLRLQLLDRK